jgi:putative sugar O-methyltransferase
MYNLPKWHKDRFEIMPDSKLLEELTKEMVDSTLEHGKPAHFWMLPSEFTSSEMQKVLHAWCGSVGELLLANAEKITEVSGSESIAKDLYEFVKTIDHLGVTENVTFQDLVNKNWRYMDIGTLMDMLLLTVFIDIRRKSGIKILEVGGGFGRLAEFLFLSSNANIQYVNIDAVPVSLMYSYLYLKKMFPNKKVCIKTNDSLIEDKCDILVLPAWHMNNIANDQFDLTVNIESMQEMNQELVDFYLKYLNQATCRNGLIYLVNSRDYKFKGIWNIPENWKCVLRHRTPRSWSRNHPVEMFIKTSRPMLKDNMIREAFYKRELKNCQNVA